MAQKIKIVHIKWDEITQRPKTDRPGNTHRISRRYQQDICMIYILFEYKQIVQLKIFIKTSIYTVEIKICIANIRNSIFQTKGPSKFAKLNLFILFKFAIVFN